MGEQANEELKFQRERLDEDRREHDQNMRLSCLVESNRHGDGPEKLVTRAKEMYEFVRGPQ